MRYRVRLPGTIKDGAGNALAPWTATFSVTTEPVAHRGPAFSYRTDLPVSAWHVPRAELPLAAVMGVSIVIKKFAAGEDPTSYLDYAAMVGMQVIVGFDYIYQDGSPDLALARSLAEKVSGHPALYGFLAVTEPEAYGLSRSDLRALAQAYRSADPTRKIVLSLGNVRQFPSWAPSHLGPGIADVVICEWYPVVARSAANPDGWTSGSARILRRGGRPSIASPQGPRSGAASPSTRIRRASDGRRALPRWPMRPAISSAIRAPSVCRSTRGRPAAVYERPAARPSAPVVVHRDRQRREGRHPLTSASRPRPSASACGRRGSREPRSDPASR